VIRGGRHFLFIYYIFSFLLISFLSFFSLSGVGTPHPLLPVSIHIRDITPSIQKGGVVVRPPYKTIIIDLVKRAKMDSMIGRRGNVEIKKKEGGLCAFLFSLDERRAEAK
jgi:hypothetical protein